MKKLFTWDGLTNYSWFDDGIFRTGAGVSYNINEPDSFKMANDFIAYKDEEKFEDINIGQSFISEGKNYIKTGSTKAVLQTEMVEFDKKTPVFTED